MFFWMDSRTVSSLRLSPTFETEGALQTVARAHREPPRTSSELVPVCVCVCVCLRTFGSSEHGGGQLTLLRLDVAQGEPAWVAVGHH